jgi:hypothetical protein
VTVSARCRAFVLFVCLLAAPALSAAQDHFRDSPPTEPRSGTNFRDVLSDSLRLLVLEHSTRIGAQHKTRRELDGPFLKDYQRSLKLPARWGDGDGWLVNYIGHPGHGAAAGFIWTHHDPRGVAAPGFHKGYWTSRLRATAWTTAYSLQFEVGPLSEASIGNVGMDPRTIGWVDHVVTPLGGFGAMVAEDVLDRFVIERLEARLRHPAVRALVRTSLNPSRALANLAGGRAPWRRQGRSLSHDTGRYRP